MALVTPAHAEEKADLLVKAFTSICVDAMSRGEPLETAAAARKWQELHGDDTKVVEPPGHKGSTRAWFVAASGQPSFFVGATTPESADKETTCSLASPEGLPADVLDAAERVMKLGKPVTRAGNAKLKHRVWKTDVGGAHLQIALDVSSKPADPGFVMRAIRKP
jgi:hypothetical protein